MTTCVVCGQREAVDRGQVCHTCPGWLAGMLRDIAQLHAQLSGDVDLVPDDRGPHWRDVPVTETDDDGRVRQVRVPGPVPGTTRVATRRVISSEHADPTTALPVGPLNAASRQGRVSGGAVEPATPLNLDAVDLALPADHRAVTDPHRDQTGHIPVASQLDAIVMDWADQRRHAYPLPTVPVLAGWLMVNLPWACDCRDDLPDFAATIRQVRSTLRGVLGLTDRPTYCHGVPCPSCQSLALSRANGEAYIGCGVCGQLLSDEEYREWTTEAARGAA